MSHAPSSLEVLAWIAGSGVLMSLVALVGSVTLLMDEATLDRVLLPLVGLAAGSLLGGAVFHLLPEGLAAAGPGRTPWAWLAGGFATFFLLEHGLHRRHAHRATARQHRPVTYLILLGDALHNFIGGLAVAGAFLVDLRVGIAAWLAAVAHEIPQELGDFAVLVNGGWPRRRALVFNLLSALTFLVGGLIAWAASFRIDVGFLLPFAAGNFIYIAAADLVPETTQAHRRGEAVATVTCFLGGLVLLWLLAAWPPAG